MATTRRLFAAMAVLASCIADLGRQIADRGGELMVRVAEVVQTLSAILQAHGPFTLWAHEETGNAWTFERDLAVKAWCRDNGVAFKEQRQFGVIRGLKVNRDTWARQRDQMMASPILPLPPLLMWERGTSDGYAYTSENRLAVAASAAPLVLIAYYPVGRILQLAQGSAYTRFDHLGSKLLAELNDSNILQRRYVHGPGDDEPVVWYEGSGLTDKRWLHSDERGSVIAVTNAAGTSIATNKYDEYDIPQSTATLTPAGAGRFHYTGQAYIPEVGLYYYKARFYSPTLGRFMQTDPIGYDDGVNWYNYVDSDPINRKDPTGLKCNSERTSCSADNAHNSRAKDVRHDSKVDAAVIKNKGKFQSATKDGGEPTGTAKSTSSGVIVSTTPSKSGTTSTADTAEFKIGKADAAVHGHIGGSVVDDPASNEGYGDTQSIEQGKPTYTVEGNRVGVHDSPDGVMRFEMVKGKMTKSEAKQIQKNLNEAQKKFNRKGPPVP